MEGKERMRAMERERKKENERDTELLKQLLDWGCVLSVGWRD